jgi:hypothetical protein
MPFALPEDPDGRLALAKGYPYDPPEACFVWRAGHVRPIAEADFSGRTPVLAHGSNRAPAQLSRKFAAQPGLEPDIPVTCGWLADSDAVYSAHVTQYGSIASTLRHVPGCRVRVAVTWLTDGQLRRMHETEGANYRYGRLARRFALDTGPRAHLPAVAAYMSDHGHLSAGDGRPLGLAAVRAEGRPHASASQEEALALVRDAHHPDEDLDAHILANVADAARRRALIRRLRATSLPADAAHFESWGPATGDLVAPALPLD